MKRPHVMGEIYAIKCGEFVKIGWSTNPKSRVGNIRNATPYKCELVGVVPGYPSDEGKVHRTLIEHRHCREWFRLEGAVLDFLKTLTPMTIPDPDTWDRRNGKRSPEVVARMAAGVRAANERRDAYLLALRLKHQSPSTGPQIASDVVSQ